MNSANQSIGFHYLTIKVCTPYLSHYGGTAQGCLSHGELNDVPLNKAQYAALTCACTPLPWLEPLHIHAAICGSTMTIMVDTCQAVEMGIPSLLLYIYPFSVTNALV